MDTTLPETGARLTCTSKTDMKTLTRFPVSSRYLPGGLSPAYIILPSAGEITAPGSEGGRRSGFRKNQPTKTVSRAPKKAAGMVLGHNRERTAARAAAPRRNGIPSGAIPPPPRPCLPGPSASAPAPRSVLGPVDQPSFRDPRHQGTEAAAHLLDRVVAAAPAGGGEDRAVGPVLQDP